VHLAIQGSGFFVLASPDIIAADGSTVTPAAASTRRFLITRDGEFRTNKDGLLVNASGYFLCTWQRTGTGAQILWSDIGGEFGPGGYVRAIYNDIDLPTAGATATEAVRLSSYITNVNGSVTRVSGAAAWTLACLMDISSLQGLKYSTFGSTVFDFGYAHTGAAGSRGSIDASQKMLNNTSSTILTKSLEASNASMTQSVPELSLAQKLFSALTKVLQTKQTNVDGVLNLIR
jgi:flagellar hook protein FlgE